MSKVKMQVCELTGNALNYAVDRAIHGEKYSEQLSIIRTRGDTPTFNPSTSWSKCGLLVENWQIFIDPPHDVHKAMINPDGSPKGCWESYENWHATISRRLAEKPPVIEMFPGAAYRGEGPNPLLAICRAVASMGGDEIEIPRELLGGK
ncbi:hypothetical protein ACSFCX_10290 [Yokenella regensburgei]|uniref:hypothetical protein n=1 Tax=Yokenella regensburgei TaxID=158877 RepID=UPI003EDAEF45